MHWLSGSNRLLRGDGFLFNRGDGFPFNRGDGFLFDRGDGFLFDRGDGFLFDRGDGFLFNRGDGFLFNRGDGFLFNRGDGFLFNRGDGFLFNRGDGFLFNRGDGFLFNRGDGFLFNRGDGFLFNRGDGFLFNRGDGFLFNRGEKRLWLLDIYRCLSRNRRCCLLGIQGPIPLGLGFGLELGGRLFVGDYELDRALGHCEVGLGFGFGFGDDSEWLSLDFGFGDDSEWLSLGVDNDCHGLRVDELLGLSLSDEGFAFSLGLNSDCVGLGYARLKLQDKWLKDRRRCAGPGCPRLAFKGLVLPGRDHDRRGNRLVGGHHRWFRCKRRNRFVEVVDDFRFGKRDACLTETGVLIPAFRARVTAAGQAEAQERRVGQRLRRARADANRPEKSSGKRQRSRCRRAVAPVAFAAAFAEHFEAGHRGQAWRALSPMKTRAEVPPA